MIKKSKGWIMLILLKAALVFLAHLAVFYMLGWLMPKRKPNCRIEGEEFIFGGLLYFFFFEIVSLVCIFAQVSLTVFSVLWSVILAVLTAVSVRNRMRQKTSRELPEFPGLEGKIILAVLLILLVFQCYLVLVHQDANPDSAFYIGQASTDVYTDTMALFDPYTGLRYEKFNVRYVLSSFAEHNAYVSKVTGLPAIVQARVVISLLTLIASYFIYWRTAYRLFKRDGVRAALTLIVISVVNLFFNTIFTNATFLLNRSYEGKAVVGNVLIPCVLYLCEKLYEDPDDRQTWIMLFILGPAGVCISMSSLFLLPVAVGAGVLPVIAAKRKWNRIPQYFLVLLPCVLMLAVYLLLSKGILPSAIR